MSITRAEQAVCAYFNEHKFVELVVIQQFQRQLEAEDNLSTLGLAMESFVETTCPNCSTAGFARFHFLGRLVHPDCGWTWYATPGMYIGRQFSAAFETGMESAIDATNDSKSKAESFFGGMFGFLVSATSRLMLAAVLIPIQAVLSLTQKKPASTASASGRS
jgi:hypothetical protein